MDQVKLQEKIALYYQKLPEETKVLFASMSWIEILQEIDVKYALNEEQVKTLGTETTLLLLGIISVDDYEETLRSEIKLEGEKINELIYEVGEKIVKDIIPSLYQAFNDNASELMQEKFGQKFDERISALPEKIKDAISDSKYQLFIYNTGNKYSLNIDQIGMLEDITMKVMVGILSPDKYEEEIKSKISIEESKIKQITLEINENVFKNIKEILKSSWDKKEEGDVPLPPYKAKQEDMVPLPPKPETETKIEKETPLIINNDLGGIDIYKEHGIEIISENETEKPQIKSNIIENTKKEEEPVKKIEELSNMNIISNKLFEKTTSTTTVSDYSVPKMNTQSTPFIKIQGDAPAKPHDPYHEAI